MNNEMKFIQNGTQQKETKESEKYGKQNKLTEQIKKETQKLKMKKKVDTNNYLVEKEITEEINYHKNSKIKICEMKILNINIFEVNEFNKIEIIN